MPEHHGVRVIDIVVSPQDPTYTLPLEIMKGAPKVWVERTM